MRQIFKTHPWVPPKELPETQELFRKYGVPGSIRPGHLLKGKGEPSKLYLITRGAAAYYVADRYKSHPSVLSLLIPGCSACDLSVITGDRVNVTTRAIGPCEVLIMQPHVLTDLMKNNSEFAAKEAAHVTRKQECSLEAMVANFTLEPTERLRRFLKVLLINYLGYRVESNSAGFDQRTIRSCGQPDSCFSQPNLLRLDQQGPLI